MAHYRYFTADLRTGIPLMALPLTEVTVEEELNEPGSLTATIPLYPLGAEAVRQVWAGTELGRTALYVVADNNYVLFGGVIWKRRLQEHALQIDAAGFLSFYSRLAVTRDLTYTGTDQLDIARGLLQHAHDQAGGNIGITLDPATTGITRDRTYLAADRKPLWEAVQELTQLPNAFDVDVRCDLAEDGTVTRNLVFGHPQLGRPAGDPNLLIEYPGNIARFDWPEEGDRMATAVFVRGEVDTVTGAVLTAEAVDTSLLSAGYPRLEVQVSAAAGVTTQEALNEQAASLLAAYRRPVTLPTFTIASGDNSPGPHPTGYRVGDWFRIRIGDRERFPPGPDGAPGHDGHMRLIRRSLALSEDTAALTFNPNPGTTVTFT